MPSDYNPNETARDWETLQQDVDSKTQRLRVQGGWLYRSVLLPTQALALVFVPIPWEKPD